MSGHALSSVKGRSGVWGHAAPENFIFDLLRVILRPSRPLNSLATAGLLIHYKVEAQNAPLVGPQ